MTKLVFVGNCQAQALHGAYAAYVAPEHDVTAHYVAAYEDADPTATALINDADVVALQITDSEQKIDIAATGFRGRVVRFPMVTAFFLWPFHSGAHPEDAKLPAEFTRVFSGNFGDRWLDRRIARGEAPDAIMAQYRDPAIVKTANLDRMIELVGEKQRERDALADLAWGAHIMDRLPHERVFLQMHHPNLPLFKLMVRDVFERLGVAAGEIAATLDHYRFSPFPNAETPVHPRIAEHLGLSWATPELKYRFAFGERVTWEDYVRRYIAHDWNEPLQRCLTMAHQHHPRVILESLALELESAAARYESSEGFLALADAKSRLGDHTGALDALRRGMASDPSDVSLRARYAGVLVQLGRPDDALPVAEDLVAWQPGFLQARIELFEIYDHLGRTREALREVQAALRLAPTHPHVARRSGELMGKSVAA